MRRLVALVVLLALSASVSRAEDFDPRQQRRLFGVRATNAARYAIEDARAALAAGRVHRGLEVAQRVLDEMADDFYLQEDFSQRESVLWSSASEVVREMLAALSPENRAIYEQIAKPGAKPLLERALRKRSARDLREVLRRFGASEAGVKAARILGELQLEEGRHRDAARAVREGLRYAPSDASLWARLVDALAMGRSHAALAALEIPEGLTYGPEAESLRARRDRLLADVQAGTERSIWPVLGGNPERNGVFAETTPAPSRLRWREQTDWQLRGQDRPSNTWGRRPAGSSQMRAALESFRPLHPVVDGRTVYVADGRSVRAYDIYSGREAWSFDARSEPTLPLLQPGSTRYGRSSLERVFAPVVAGDLIIATVELTIPYEPDYLQGVEITSYLARRVVVAIDKKTGRMRWWMGKDGLDRLSLGALSILSSPIVAEGLVLAVGGYYDGNHNVSFLAFDVATGALRWKRSLGFGQQELNLFGYSLKELAATPVTVSDGVAYASTGLGFVAAVDIRSGVPRWLASYEIVPIRKVELWYDAPVRLPLQASSPPIVYGDSLIVAPSDGKHVYVFDKNTGRLRWREAYASSHSVRGVRGRGHLLGVLHDGKREVVLLTDRQLRARALKDGSTAWTATFDPEDDQVIGRGAIAGDEVLVPTRSGLQRFALKSDGAYRGADPWPDGAVPGNVLPLARVLVVTSRSAIQWFYDWAAIERDVARRRKENPDDPTILLEAGEMYLRGGGEIERALRAFKEALVVAQRSAPALVPRAKHGIYMTWLTEGDQRVGAFAEQAVVSYRKALPFAIDAEATVEVRIRIHRALPPKESAARIANLEALVEEAGTTEARFDPAAEPVPARAAGLVRLSAEHLRAERPGEAIDALQRVIAEEPDATFPAETGVELAQRMIARILDRTGPLPYRKHEIKAKALLAKAIASKDPELLERLLASYPNAEVVNDALLERARGLLADGKALEASRYLQRLLRGVPDDHRIAATALAALARAYRLAGARGAASATLRRLARGSGASTLTWDGTKQTGAAFAAAERKLLKSPAAETGPIPTLRAPLTEVHFEPVGDEEFARPLLLATDGSESDRPPPAPLSLMSRGRDLVAIDMRRGAVAWKRNTGPCQRAAYVDGVVVLALTREIKGYDGKTGKELWAQPTGSLARDLQVAGGLIFAQLQDVRAATAGDQHILALDAQQGNIVWSQKLPRSDYRNMTVWGGNVLLQQVEYRNRTANQRVLVFEAFDGTKRHVLDIPLAIDANGTLAVDDLYLVAGSFGRKGQRMLVALDLQRGKEAWRKPLKGTGQVCSLTRNGQQVLVLRSDGSLLTHQIATGVAVAETKVYVTDRGRSCPFPGTHVHVTGSRITMLPWARRPNFGVVSFERRTGKLAWDATYEKRVSPSKAALVLSGDVLCAMISYPKNRVQNILVRLLDANTGAILQEIEPEGLSKENWIPSLASGYGTLVIFGKTGASIFRPENDEEPKKPMPGR